MTVALLFGVFLPTLSRPKAKVCGIRCVDQLKQAGLAFRMWSNDQGEKFPWQVSTNQGGTLELTESGDPLPHFQAVSNELNTPKVLVCSSDTTRVRVASFDQFTNRSQLSYFVGLDADETRPNSILTGDRSVSTNGQFHSGLIGMATSAPLNWAGGIHPPGLGNIGLGDGSAQQFANGPFWFQCAPDTNPVIRLVIP